MECTIQVEQNNTFLNLFKNYKHISEYISIYVYTDKLYLQNMDSNLICLCDLTVTSKWFEKFKGTDKFNFNIKSETFSKILATHEKDHQIKLSIKPEHDKLSVTFKGKKNKKQFKIALQSISNEIITIENKDYDIEFSLDSKIFDTYCNQLSSFGEIITIDCCDETIELKTKSIEANMNIEIPINVLSHFEIVDKTSPVKYNNNFDKKYFNIVGTFKTVCNDIFMYLQDDIPLEIKIKPDDTFIFRMFIAPQIKDNE